jgi:hypothetical protein
MEMITASEKMMIHKELDVELEGDLILAVDFLMIKWNFPKYGA